MALLTIPQVVTFLSQRERIWFLVTRAATNISAEGATTKPQVDLKRSALASRVAGTGSDALIEPITRVVALAVDAASPTAPTDIEITNAVAGVWNQCAGVTPADKA